METRIINNEKELLPNSIVIDIDKGIELLLEFNRKTVIFEKEFQKLTKKQNGKDPDFQKKLVLKFVKEKLLNIFKYEFLDKFYLKEEYKKLENEILLTYIFGIFVIGHSKKFENDIMSGYAKVIKEMSDRIYGS